MTALEDITPEGSLAPVFHDPAPLTPVNDAPDIGSQETLRASAMQKLMAGAPLTEDEASIITGAAKPAAGNGGSTPTSTGRIR
jgi:hypothetical protein